MPPAVEALHVLDIHVVRRIQYRAVYTRPHRLRAPLEAPPPTLERGVATEAPLPGSAAAPLPDVREIVLDMREFDLEGAAARLGDCGEVAHAQRVARTFTIEKPSRSGCPCFCP